MNKMNIELANIIKQISHNSVMANKPAMVKFGVVTKEEVTELCKQDRHYFSSDIKINANRYFYCKLYTD